MNVSAKLVLAERGLRPKSSFGQNFLQDEKLCARLAELAAPRGAAVLEFGAGLGALTAPLLERAAHVIAVERDRDLLPLLEEKFAAEIASGKLTLLEADAKAIDPAAVLAGYARPRVLAGNLPYNITGPLLEKAVHASRAIDRVVYLVQLEVADRLAARAGQEAYGALSVFVQAAFRVERALVVRRGAFYPQPRVDSAFVVFEPHAVPVSEETETFRSLVRGAFGQRRKKLRNAWHAVSGASAERLADAAARAGINLDDRGETLSVEAFAAMARELDR
ncbi:MAG TPA: 16S rRNA (adenine(1518)-N(6)/adenine(1519)-N(6))-dimethyltransferase RsmA [Polyangiaceae bacterium]|nr:16S rRNA (adenine(1518)-N(6)/adenine(1519)-N(6))-dimethyltransferase RsmA [Polyangiaceae bacterium]